MRKLETLPKDLYKNYFPILSYTYSNDLDVQTKSWGELSTLWRNTSRFYDKRFFGDLTQTDGISLILAIVNHDIEMVRTIITEAPETIFKPDCVNGVFPLDVAALYDYEIFKILYETAKTIKITCPLQIFLMVEIYKSLLNIKLFSILTKRVKDPLAIFYIGKTSFSSKVYLIHHLVREEDINGIIELVTEYPECLILKDPYGFTPLQIAMDTENLQVIEAMSPAIRTLPARKILPENITCFLVYTPIRSLAKFLSLKPKEFIITPTLVSALINRDKNTTLRNRFKLLCHYNVMVSNAEQYDEYDFSVESFIEEAIKKNDLEMLQFRLSYHRKTIVLDTKEMPKEFSDTIIEHNKRLEAHKKHKKPTIKNAYLQGQRLITEFNAKEAHYKTELKPAKCVTETERQRLLDMLHLCFEGTEKLKNTMLSKGYPIHSKKEALEAYFIELIRPSKDNPYLIELLLEDGTIKGCYLCKIITREDGKEGGKYVYYGKLGFKDPNELKNPRMISILKWSARIGCFNAIDKRNQAKPNRDTEYHIICSATYPGIAFFGFPKEYYPLYASIPSQLAQDIVKAVKPDTKLQDGYLLPQSTLEVKDGAYPKALRHSMNAVFFKAITGDPQKGSIAIADISNPAAGVDYLNLIFKGFPKNAMNSQLILFYEFFRRINNLEAEEVNSQPFTPVYSKL